MCGCAGFFATRVLFHFKCMKPLLDLEHNLELGSKDGGLMYRGILGGEARPYDNSHGGTQGKRSLRDQEKT